MKKNTMILILGAILAAVLYFGMSGISALSKIDTVREIQSIGMRK